MFAYLEGVPGGSDLEKLVKNYNKISQEDFYTSVIILPILLKSYSVMLSVIQKLQLC